MGSDGFAIFVAKFDAPGIDPAFVSGSYGTKSRRWPSDAEALRNIFAGAETDGSKHNIVARTGIKDGVGNFIDGTIAATGDETFAALPDRPPAEFVGVAAAFGEREIRGHPAGRDAGFERGDSFPGTSAARRGVDDEEWLRAHCGKVHGRERYATSSRH